MKLPIGMLIYWTHRFSDDHAVISGIWYYKEIYVPATKEEKKQSFIDLKNRRCALLNITGTFDQIADILMQCDRFQGNEDVLFQVDGFNKLRQEMLDSKDKAVIFDDVYSIKGTSLAIDSSIDIDEDMEYIMSKIRSKTPIVEVNISKGWSFSKDLSESLSKI